MKEAPQLVFLFRQEEENYLLLDKPQLCSKLSADAGGSGGHIQHLLCAAKTVASEELSSDTEGLLAGWSSLERGVLSEARPSGRVLRALELGGSLSISNSESVLTGWWDVVVTSGMWPLLPRWCHHFCGLGCVA